MGFFLLKLRLQLTQAFCFAGIKRAMSSSDEGGRRRAEDFTASQDSAISSSLDGQGYEFNKVPERRSKARGSSRPDKNSESPLQKKGRTKQPAGAGSRTCFSQPLKARSGTSGGKKIKVEEFSASPERRRRGHTAERDRAVSMNRPAFDPRVLARETPSPPPRRTRSREDEVPPPPRSRSFERRGRSKQRENRRAKS